jgi:hypothetical protein
VGQHARTEETQAEQGQGEHPRGSDGGHGERARRQPGQGAGPEPAAREPVGEPAGPYQDGCAGQRACTVQVAELAVGDGEIGFQMTGESDEIGLAEAGAEHQEEAAREPADFRAHVGRKAWSQPSFGRRLQ